METFIPGPGEYRGPDWGHTIALLCVRCGMQRFVTIDSLGNISTSRYIAPPDYKLPADEVPTNGELRIALLRDQRKTEREGARRRNGKRAS